MRIFPSDTLGDLASRVADVACDTLHSADVDTIREGVEWYPRAYRFARDLAYSAGISIDQASAIMAVLSPRLRWQHNLDDADRVAHGSSDNVAALGPNLVKAWNILEATDTDTINGIVGGRKVRSFWRNIRYPNNSLDVTLDGWMATGFRGALEATSGLSDLSPTRCAKLLYVRGSYDAISDGVRVAADRHAISPSALQAILWIVWRGSAE